MTTPLRPEIKLIAVVPGTVCNTCGTDTGVRCLSFRWSDKTGRVPMSGGTAVALCKTCRHEMLSVLAQEVADDPDVPEIEFGAAHSDEPRPDKT